MHREMFLNHRIASWIVKSFVSLFADERLNILRASQVQYLDTVTCYYWGLECRIQTFLNFSGELLPLS